MLSRHPSVVLYRDQGMRVRLVNVASVRHRAQVRKIHAVAASLHPPESRSGQSGRTKQETPQIAVREVSTAPDQVASDRRAASAQSDTDG